MLTDAGQDLCMASRPQFCGWLVQTSKLDWVIEFLFVFIGVGKFLFKGTLRCCFYLFAKSTYNKFPTCVCACVFEWMNRPLRKHASACLCERVCSPLYAFVFAGRKRPPRQCQPPSDLLRHENHQALPVTPPPSAVSFLLRHRLNLPSVERWRKEEEGQGDFLFEFSSHFILFDIYVKIKK